MNTQEKSQAITYERAYLSSGFRTVLFPINVALLLRVLPEAGFVLSGQMPRAVPLRGRWMIQADDVARKGEFRLALSSERGFIGLDGPDPASVVDEFVLLKGFLQDRLGIEVDARATFHEFLSSGSIRGKKNPLETFALLSQPLATFGELERLLSEAMALFGIRLVSAGQDPNQPDWTEITIEPMVEQATQFYRFDVVFRRGNAQPVIEFVKSFSETLKQLIKHLEQG